MKKGLARSILACSLFALMGCGVTSSPPPPPIGVSLSQTTATVQAGATAQFTATVSNDSANKGVTWAVTCSAAACGSVSPAATASGAATTYTAPGPPATTLTVMLTATSVADASKPVTATITVPAVTVSVSPSTATLNAGAMAQFTATVGNDPSNKGVNWTVSCTATSCGSVSPATTPSGTATTYTAPSAAAPILTVTLTANSVADITKSAAVTITIPAITISVSPTAAAVQVGGTAQFTATVANDPANQGVTWTVSCSTAACGSVSPAATGSGTATTYTAPASPPASNLTVTLTATSVTDKTKSTSATITVPSVAVSVAPASTAVGAGSTSRFTATVAGDSSNKGVTWTVSCSPAPCGGVSPTSTASGAATTYTAPSTPPANDLTVTLTATSVANPLAFGSVSITVPAITVSISPGSAIVEAASTAQFTATVSNDPSNQGVNWTVSCSAAPCGSVSPTSTPSGTATTYTAPSTPPAKNLSVTLTATSMSNSTKSATATVTVRAILVSAVSPPSGIIPINATQTFSATANYDPTNAGVNWTVTQNGTNCALACGTVSPANTPSGTPTTYTAPATVPANANVTINAISAADTTKSSTAAITVTNGTVKLIPASLHFHCKVTATRPTCTSQAQTITLTNAGSSVITIRSITITGSNPSAFSETNNCSASVAAGASCTVNVSLGPVGLGSYSASVAFNDSSPDSPQQVALSGLADHNRPLNQAAALSELTNATSAAVPAPTGTDMVGTRVLHLVDATREDPYLANGTKRELAIRLWYPASLQPNQKCMPAEYASPAVWKYFAQLVGVRPFPVKTNSCLEVPVADGVHPVVVFTPGYTATFTDYTFLMEDLASRGYVVVSVAHTYETTAVELADGRLAKSVVGSHLGGPMQSDDRSLSTAAYARLLDLKFVVDELARMNAQHDSVLAGKLDLSKIAVAGHSLGGLTALLASQFDPRFQAAIIMDGFVPAALPSATKMPVFILAAGREGWEPTESHLWNNLAGPRLAVNLRGTEHVALSDWIWLTPDSVTTGPMGPEKTMTAMRDYIAAFLDANLRGMTDRTQDRLLSGSSSEYPDAEVITQNELLPGK